jgi:hypothetical protein
VVNKFNAEKTDANGRTFDSGREAARAVALQWLEHLGKITNLRYQVSFELIPKQGRERSVTYRADFVYTDVETGLEVVEDAKGCKKQVYIIKRKLMLWVHHITILET